MVQCHNNMYGVTNTFPMHFHGVTVKVITVNPNCGHYMDPTSSSIIPTIMATIGTVKMLTDHDGTAQKVLFMSNMFTNRYALILLYTFMTQLLHTRNWKFSSRMVQP